jgi:GT2 family glycosyltransferase
MSFAPIALFVYNRPGHLKRTVEALGSARHAGESSLWVFCDGPKRPEDAQTISEVRMYARSIRGFANVTIVERERNLGLAVSVTEGVRRLCDEFGRVIVVEDDLMVAS